MDLGVVGSIPISHPILFNDLRSICNTSKMHFATTRADIANTLGLHVAPRDGRRSLLTWSDIVGRDGHNDFR